MKAMLKKHRTYVIAFAVTLLLYSIMFGFGITCPIKYLTGLSCPGCGMTRAILCLLRFDFSGAWFYHPLVFALPIFALAYIFFAVKRNKKAQNITLIVIATVFFAVYLARMIFGDGQIVSFSPENSVFYNMFT